MTAPMLLDGSTDGPAFHGYVEQASAPTLSPGDIAITDNLPPHYPRRSASPWRRRGAARLHRPPDTPDFRPIGNVFAKSEALLRKAAARIWAVLNQAVSNALPITTRVSTFAGYKPE